MKIRRKILKNRKLVLGLRSFGSNHGMKTSWHAINKPADFYLPGWRVHRFCGVSNGIAQLVDVGERASLVNGVFEQGPEVFDGVKVW